MTHKGKGKFKTPQQQEGWEILNESRLLRQVRPRYGPDMDEWSSAPRFHRGPHLPTPQRRGGSGADAGRDAPGAPPTSAKRMAEAQRWQAEHDGRLPTRRDGDDLREEVLREEALREKVLAQRWQRWVDAADVDRVAGAEEAAWQQEVRHAAQTTAYSPAPDADSTVGGHDEEMQCLRAHPAIRRVPGCQRDGCPEGDRGGGAPGPPRVRDLKATRR